MLYIQLGHFAGYLLVKIREAASQVKLIAAVWMHKLINRVALENMQAWQKNWPCLDSGSLVLFRPWSSPELGPLGPLSPLGPLGPSGGARQARWARWARWARRARRPSRDDNLEGDLVGILSRSEDSWFCRLKKIPVESLRGDLVDILVKSFLVEVFVRRACAGVV